MKHFLLTLLLTFVVGISSAQTEHMKFKGIPMEGTLRTFTGQLRAKGFATVATQDGISLLNGEFAGYSHHTNHFALHKEMVMRNNLGTVA